MSCFLGRLRIRMAPDTAGPIFDRSPSAPNGAAGSEPVAGTGITGTESSAMCLGLGAAPNPTATPRPRLLTCRQRRDIGRGESAIVNRHVVDCPAYRLLPTETASGRVRYR